MRILIGGTPSKIFHVKEFSNELIKKGIDSKVITDTFIPPLVRHLVNWFQSEKNFDRVIQDFKPDLVLAIQPSKFGLSAVKAKVPLLIHLRGNYFTEAKMRKETIRNFLASQNYWLMERIEQKCLKESKAILAVCNYLKKITNEYYPKKLSFVLYNGLNLSHWFPDEGLQLKHPCVGLVQTANIWGKAKEMLLLPKILDAMPDVTFHWVGDGPYRDKILPTLAKYDNFKWLGKLEYPEKVRQFLTEIDVYALITGLDMTPKSLLEAQLMEKPVVATNVGGIAEIMKNNETGYLVEEGNHLDWIERLSELLNDENKRKRFGAAGRSFVKENFSLEKCASNFLEICKKLLYKK